MNELAIWLGWSLMLVGVPVMVLPLGVNEWIRTPLYQTPPWE